MTSDINTNIANLLALKIVRKNTEESNDTYRTEKTPKPDKEENQIKEEVKVQIQISDE